MAQRLVIIGNGMAAVRLVEQLLTRAPERFAITLIGEEPAVPYNRILLSPVLGGEKPAEQTQLHDALWYQRYGVTLLTGERAVAVSLTARTVTTTARTLHWDELVFATGSTPFLPPVEGGALAHVHAFRTLADVEAILATPGPAVVLGGGLLGVEAAAALARHGADVTLVHRHPWLMEQQLDAQAGKWLAQSLRARGIRVVTGSGITRITQGNVTLADGETIAAGRVVMATGVRPAIGLAQAAGLRCTRGIVVDDALRASHPQVSAVGECSEINGQTWGLVAPGLQQADVLAARLCGETARFAYEERGTRLKVTGIAVFSAGVVDPGPQAQTLISLDPIARHYRRLIIEDGRLTGVLLYGDTDSAGALMTHFGQPLRAGVGLLFDEPHESQPAAAGCETMTKQTLVVVGHGMVGHHFLEQCVNAGLQERFHIIVFGEERHPAYDRVHLSEYFAGRSAQSLSMVQDDFFAQTGIELRTGCQIVAIDRARQTVRDAQGHETHFDKLVLATGSWPFVPPVPGRDLPGCFVYRTLDDLDAIRERAQHATRGVVVGGGLLGLEAANALKQLGLKTHVVEFAPGLMAVQLDAPGAAMLREKIEALDVSVHTSKSTTAIVEEEGGLTLQFADGDRLHTDLIVFSAGIRPQDMLAKAAGLTTGERGGIVINDQCQTCDEHIFAIGECALWESKIFGLVAPGYQMARVAAATLAGETAAFRGADMSTKLKLLGVEVASFGDAHARTPGSQSYQWTHGPKQIYKKIVVSADGKTLLGGVLVGDSSDYATLLQMMLNGMALPA
ncbi:FAD-dependent oxidoreductase, partial [Cronobacter dublinensis]